MVSTKIHPLTLCLLVSTLAPVHTALGVQPKVEERPNLIFILTDDQRWDTLGFAGNEIIQTPHMDQLAEDGFYFENSFVTTPICATSRASLVTGLYERTHGFTFGTPPLQGQFVDLSYPKLLKAAGYYTGFIGKFGMSFEDDADQDLFDVYDRPGEQFWATTYYRLTRDHTGHRHLTREIGDKGIRFLNNRPTDQPFCLSLSFHAPHAEDIDPRQFIYPVELESLYKDDTIPPAPLSDPHFYREQPEWVRVGLNKIRWHWRFSSPEQYQEMVKGYYRMITGIDIQIGRIRDRLRELGIDQNTIIIFMGDNGYFLNERLLAGKWLMYENSLRVPLIVYDPREDAPVPQRLDHLALNIDIAPTLLQYAGIPIPDSVQGKPLQHAIRGRDDWRTAFLCEHLFENPRIPKSEGVRTEQFKYFRYIDHPEHEELYDLHTDPLEVHNLVENPQYAKVLQELSQQCDDLIEQSLMP